MEIYINSITFLNSEEEFNFFIKYKEKSKPFYPFQMLSKSEFEKNGFKRRRHEVCLKALENQKLSQ